MATALAVVDHLVYATPNVDASIQDLEQRLGVCAAAGGQHHGRGTRNALIALSKTTYLEIIGPDPAQVVTTPRWFAIDALSRPRLVTWAAKATNLPAVVESAARAGVALGEVAAGSRVRPDGVTLNWTFTDPVVVVADAIVPFFIDWGSSPHPAASAPDGPALIDLRAEHPAPAPVRAMLSALAIDLPVAEGPLRLIATLRTSRGVVQLQ